MISPFITNLQTVSSELSEDKKLSHKSVSYTDVSPYDDKHCSDCMNYIAPLRCRGVKSPVQPNGYCEHYKRIRG